MGIRDHENPPYPSPGDVDTSVCGVFDLLESFVFINPGHFHFTPQTSLRVFFSDGFFWDEFDHLVPTSLCLCRSSWSQETREKERESRVGFIDCWRRKEAVSVDQQPGRQVAS